MHVVWSYKAYSIYRIHIMYRGCKGVVGFWGTGCLEFHSFEALVSSGLGLGTLSPKSLNPKPQNFRFSVLRLEGFGGT